MAGPAKGIYYDAYVMIDIYSRYIVGCQVHARESGQLACEFIAQVFATDRVPLVVHGSRHLDDLEAGGRAAGGSGCP